MIKSLQRSNMSIYITVEGWGEKVIQTFDPTCKTKELSFSNPIPLKRDARSCNLKLSEPLIQTNRNNREFYKDPHLDRQTRHAILEKLDRQDQTVLS